MDVDKFLRFHQMNCLASLRQKLQSAHQGLSVGNGLDKEDLHWSHCFDYLYQVMGLLCKFEATVREADEFSIS